MNTNTLNTLRTVAAQARVTTDMSYQHGIVREYSDVAIGAGLGLFANKSWKINQCDDSEWVIWHSTVEKGFILEGAKVTDWDGNAVSDEVRDIVAAFADFALCRVTIKVSVSDWSVVANAFEKAEALFG